MPLVATQKKFDLFVIKKISIDSNGESKQEKVDNLFDAFFKEEIY